MDNRERLGSCNDCEECFVDMEHGCSVCVSSKMNGLGKEELLYTTVGQNVDDRCFSEYILVLILL